MAQPEVPLLERVSDYVALYAERAPAAEALALGELRVNYATLRREMDALSGALLAAGVRRGDRVATLCTPHPDFFLIFLATVSIGAIWVGLNPRYLLEELRFVLADSEPVLIFARARIGTRDYGADIEALRGDVPAAGWVILGSEPAPYGVTYENFVATAAGMSADPLVAARAAVQCTDPALLVYTSGSSGRPKGALLTHQGLVICCRVQQRHWATNPLRTLNCFPINHIGSVGDISCFTLVSGGCIVFLEQFSPPEVAVLLSSERITVWIGVPTTFLLTLADPQFQRTDLSSMQRILWGGAAASTELVDALLALGKSLGTAYGLTESVGSVTYTADDASREALIESVGTPPADYEVRVLGESGDAAGADVVGEIQLRGSFLMSGYWRNAEATRRAFTQDGWLKTGDLGVFRSDGSLRIVGRLTEMFKSGGYNVYPREVELVLEKFSGVALAAVVAVADPLYGQVGHAFVTPEPRCTLDAGTLVEHCRAHLANYKIPKRIRVILDPPMLPIGKIDKRALAELAAQDLAS